MEQTPYEKRRLRKRRIANFTKYCAEQGITGSHTILNLIPRYNQNVIYCYDPDMKILGSASSKNKIAAEVQSDLIRMRLKKQRAETAKFRCPLCKKMILITNVAGPCPKCGGTGFKEIRAKRERQEQQQAQLHTELINA